jgi:formylglycine-generating enzyme required for sulfatase activity
MLSGFPAIGETVQHSMLQKIAANMVEVPGGTYMMVARPEKDEKEGHWVKVEPFLISRYEVTQREYRAVMGKNPSFFKGDSNLPIEQVSWADAQEFIKELNVSEGEEVYRLPTEAEWEYICLASSKNEYGFGEDGDQLAQYAWYEANSLGKTHPVGRLTPNRWGLYDVHGNVWEWVQDWHGDFPAGAVTAAEGQPKTQFRILRGGGYDSPDGNCRSHNRRSYSPMNARVKSVGFRLARTVPTRLIFTEVLRDYPILGELVNEDGFNGLSGKEQRELMRLLDKYVFFVNEAKYYDRESPGTSLAYSRMARTVKKQIQGRFKHILKK